jgi:hypothetical protein
MNYPAVQSHQEEYTLRSRGKRGVVQVYLCMYFGGIKAIGHKEMIFHPSGVSQVVSFKGKIIVPGNDYVLKVE